MEQGTSADATHNTIQLEYEELSCINPRATRNPIQSMKKKKTKPTKSMTQIGYPFSLTLLILTRASFRHNF